MLRNVVSMILIASMLLTACGDQNQSVSDAEQTSEKTTAASKDETNKITSGKAAESKDVTTDTADDSLDETLNETEETKASATSGHETTREEVVDKTYHMNSNYVIKPNNESSSAKVVLLTFDDGPKEEKMITSLIDTLDKHDAKAIFFVNGYRVKHQPELLQLIHERGQIIGNHAWDHEDLKKMPQAEAIKQVTDVQQLVKDIIGEQPQFFRPPFGSGNDALKGAVQQQGMLYMTWSNGSLDWDKSTKNKPDKVIQNVLDQLHPGSNILMHELPWTVEGLDELLTQLEQKGYSFVDPRAIEHQTR
ncbi:polysaccharide deacetylase family protein [Paenibacillus sp. FSL R7-0652]|uniref:Polysaccharide deacetylase family protein n=1 Tax=Paenibacillus sp. AN1007 TaxID=3151385 RepID=A0AAU8NI22_9BACL